ncbi:AraC family transcriptional regulator [Dysgonomonas sp.]
MKKNIEIFDWQDDVKKEKITSIDNDLILLEKPIIKPEFIHPFKVDMVTAQICLCGKTEGSINLNSYSSTASSLTIIMPDQILQHKYTSEDFSALFIIMSQKFIDSLNIQQNISLFMSVAECPVIPLSERDLQATVTYYEMLKDAIKQIDNPFRLETVRHLTMAFFYGVSYQFHDKTQKLHKSKNEIIIDKFLTLVRNNYKKERTVGFYANGLCLTPKYLSSLIKTNTNLSANDWIDRYVILEAEALLKSTNMTIQQISDELNFPSQSFFGKYFKRHTNISPREYRKLS